MTQAVKLRHYLTGAGTRGGCDGLPAVVGAPGSVAKGLGPAALDSAWEYELLLSSDVSPTADRDESRFLPREYQAIASAFLGS